MRTGAEQLLAVFRSIAMTTETFESRGHTRIKQIQHLLATGQVDRRLFWIEPVGEAAGTATAARPPS